MKTFLAFLRFLSLSIFVVLTQLITSILLSWPLNTVQVPLFCLSLILLLTESRLLVWQAALIFYCLEFYSPFPFGVLLFSGTLATLLGFWLYQNVVTNRSWYSAMGLVTSMILFFHVFHAASIFLFFGREQTSVFISSIFLIQVLQEIFFSALLIGCVVSVWVYGERKKRYGSIISWISRNTS